MNSLLASAWFYYGFQIHEYIELWDYAFGLFQRPQGTVFKYADTFAVPLNKALVETQEESFCVQGSIPWMKKYFLKQQ